MYFRISLREQILAGNLETHCQCLRHLYVLRAINIKNEGNHFLPVKQNISLIRILQITQILHYFTLFLLLQVSCFPLFFMFIVRWRFSGRSEATHQRYGRCGRKRACSLKYTSDITRISRRLEKRHRGFCRFSSKILNNRF